MTTLELEPSTRGKRPVERQKMRPWLIELLNKKKTDGLIWEDRDQSTFRINWKHGARNGWNINKDANVFELYAIHTGRHRKDQSPNPKRWKANFRCALHSLGDVEEVKTEGTTRGNNAYRVFKFLEEKKKPLKRPRQQSTESDADSGVESPTPCKKPVPYYSLRSRRRKKPYVKKEIDTSDSSDAALDSPNVQPVVKDVSLPVPSKDSDDVIENRVKTEYTELLGTTSGTFPHLGCGFVMIRFGENSSLSTESKDKNQEKESDDDESNEDSDSDEETNDTFIFHSPNYSSAPQTPSTSQQISVPDYSNLIRTPDCHTSDVNIMSSTFDQQGNLVIAAQVEIQVVSSDQATQLPVPVIDLMHQPSE
ncbi:interferon regulatory factor 1-like [Mizuhopecten yessoensis]|nr:interferon regulatory factor 1-like [Mizuhopecten yessoensis]XP_021363372.1 interferon regulatory factor 1-like [Mizuhopecten yessoensis]